MTEGKMTPEEEARFAEQDRKRFAESAREIINCANVLELFAEDVANVVAGEADNAKLLYLTATSRLFPKTMSAAVKGTSSGGKSILRTEVLRFFPPEDVACRR
jgi:hypothetical protein